MRVICAWCGKYLEDKPGDGVSHSICEECYDKEIKKLNDNTEEDYYETGRRVHY